MAELEQRLCFLAGGRDGKQEMCVVVHQRISLRHTACWLARADALLRQGFPGLNILVCSASAKASSAR